MTPRPLLRRLVRRLRGLALALPVMVACAAPLDDMRRFVEAGQFEEAYRTAHRNPDLIGNVHFDFLYGLAAVNTGHVPEGLLALERHLAAVPANDRARLELARGYFLLGEYGRARTEFEFVLRYNPPAGVRSNIQRYLDAMAAREATERRTASRTYAEAGIGHDSNVNGGTFHDELSFSFGDVSLVGSPSKGLADNFVQLAGGGQQEMRVSNRLSLFAGLDLDYKRNAELHDYDLGNLAANVGFTVLSGPGLYRATLAVNTLNVGANRYRDILSLAAEGNYSLGPSLQLMVQGQYAELRYAGADDVRDSHATMLTAVLTKNFSDLPGAASAGLRISYTQEDNLRLRTDLDRRVPLVRLFASASPADRWRIAAGLTAFAQKFGAQDIAFGTVRSDTATSADLTVNYSLAPNWSIRAEWIGIVNRSNQDLYDSRRQAIAIKSRYQY